MTAPILKPGTPTPLNPACDARMTVAQAALMARALNLCLEAGWLADMEEAAEDLSDKLSTVRSCGINEWCDL